MNDLTSLLSTELAYNASLARDGFLPSTLLEGARRGARRKRRTRTSLQAFGCVALATLIGGAAWLLLGQKEEPHPGVNPMPSVSPTASPAVSPTPSPQDISGLYSADEFGLPVFPDGDSRVLDDVGPGWVLAQYVGVMPREYIDPVTRNAGLYLIDPTGEVYSLGQVGDAQATLMWRRDRNEVVFSDSNGSTFVYDFETRTSTLVDPEDRPLSYRGTTDDGREVYFTSDGEYDAPWVNSGFLAVTPDPGVPDAFVELPDTSNSIGWSVMGNDLIGVPDFSIGEGVGSTTVWKVSLDGSATTLSLALPPGKAYCTPSSTAQSYGMPFDLLWECREEVPQAPSSDADASERPEPQEVWLLPLDGGPATSIPVDRSRFDQWQEAGNRLPGCGGVDMYNDPTPGDRPVYWFLYEYPDR